MAEELVVEAMDLQLFMGVDSIDEDRAQLMLELVIDAANDVVTPLTMSARAIILTAAARAYSNPPGGVTSELVGPYQATRSLGGAYLTKGERAALRRITGGGGAFSIDPTPADAGPYKSWSQAVYSSLDGDNLAAFDSISEV